MPHDDSKKVTIKFKIKEPTTKKLQNDRLKDYKPSAKWMIGMQAWERMHKPKRKKASIKPSGHKARIDRMKKNKKK